MARRAIGFADHFVCHVCAALRFARLGSCAGSPGLGERAAPKMLRGKPSAARPAAGAEAGERRREAMNQRTKWMAVLCVLGALLLGAFVAAEINSTGVTEADWIEAIQSADAN